jgi:hypothetical protein
VRVDVQIIVDVVTVIGAGIVAEHGREPNRRAAEAGDVVQVPGNALDLAAVEVLGGRNSRGASRLPHRRPVFTVVKAIDQQEVDELFPPFAKSLEIALAGDRREIDLVDGCRSCHGNPRGAVAYVPL